MFVIMYVFYNTSSLWKFYFVLEFSEENRGRLKVENLLDVEFATNNYKYSVMLKSVLRANFWNYKSRIPFPKDPKK